MPCRVRHSRSAKIDTGFRVHREDDLNRQPESERKKRSVKSPEENTTLGSGISRRSDEMTSVQSDYCGRALSVEILSDEDRDCKQLLAKDLDDQKLVGRQH